MQLFGLFFIAIVLSFFLTPLAKWLSVVCNVVDKPGFRKIHAKSIPLLGGLAVYFAFILITSSQPYHMYHYAQRDTITFPYVTVEVLKRTIKNRPLYLVEDPGSIYNPEMINKVKNTIKRAGLNFNVVGEVELFSPHVGQTNMHIYRIRY
jgi:predicted PurR-regulated permease PerM